jgi:hypothetical protein
VRALKLLSPTDEEQKAIDKLAAEVLFETAQELFSQLTGLS